MEHTALFDMYSILHSVRLRMLTAGQPDTCLVNTQHIALCPSVSELDAEQWSSMYVV